MDLGVGLRLTSLPALLQARCQISLLPAHPPEARVTRRWRGSRPRTDTTYYPISRY